MAFTVKPGVARDHRPIRHTRPRLSRDWRGRSPAEDRSLGETIKCAAKAALVARSTISGLLSSETMKRECRPPPSPPPEGRPPSASTSEDRELLAVATRARKMSNLGLDLERAVRRGMARPSARTLVSARPPAVPRLRAGDPLAFRPWATDHQAGCSSSCIRREGAGTRRRAGSLTRARDRPGGSTDFTISPARDRSSPGESRNRLRAGRDRVLGRELECRLEIRSIRFRRLAPGLAGDRLQCFFFVVTGTTSDARPKCRAGP
jgi:hypothetical protein